MWAPKWPVFYRAVDKAPEAADAWKSFWETYKRDYVDRFEQGATFRVRQKDGRNFYRIPDEEVGKAYFHAGGDAAADQFNRTFAGNPQALDTPKSMAKLWAATGTNEAARSSLRRNVWNRIADGSAEDILTALDKNGASLQIALGKRHVDNLRRVMNARAMIENVPPANAQAFGTNALQKAEDFVGMGAPQIGCRIFAVRSGRTSARYVAVDMLGRFMLSQSQASQAALFREALYDPDVARSLVNMAFIKGTAKNSARSLNTRLFNLGMEGGDDE